MSNNNTVLKTITIDNTMFDKNTTSNIIGVVSYIYKFGKPKKIEKDMLKKQSEEFWLIADNKKDVYPIEIQKIEEKTVDNTNNNLELVIDIDNTRDWYVMFIYYDNNDINNSKVVFYKGQQDKTELGKTPVSIEHCIPATIDEIKKKYNIFIEALINIHNYKKFNSPIDEKDKKLVLKDKEEIILDIGSKRIKDEPSIPIINIIDTLKQFSNELILKPFGSDYGVNTELNEMKGTLDKLDSLKPINKIGFDKDDIEFPTKYEKEFISNYLKLLNQKYTKRLASQINKKQDLGFDDLESYKKDIKIKLLIWYFEHFLNSKKSLTDITEGDLSLLKKKIELLDTLDIFDKEKFPDFAPSSPRLKQSSQTNQPVTRAQSNPTLVSKNKNAQGSNTKNILQEDVERLTDTLTKYQQNTNRKPTEKQQNTQLTPNQQLKQSIETQTTYKPELIATKLVNKNKKNKNP